MYAVVEAGGQQHRVAQGDTIKVQKIITGEEKELILDRVLIVSKGDDLFIGQPYLENASIKAEVQGNKKSAKVMVYKQKPRKGHRKLRGHRQDYTVLRIKDIVVGG